MYGVEVLSSVIVIKLCGRLLVHGGLPCVVSCIRRKTRTLRAKWSRTQGIDALMPGDLGIGRT